MIDKKMPSRNTRYRSDSLETIEVPESVEGTRIGVKLVESWRAVEPASQSQGNSNKLE